MAENNRKRNWAFVVYPESLPDNWIDELRLTGLKAVISPLHDKDVNPDGTTKKPHYHVIVAYSGPTSYKVVKSVAVDKLHGASPIPLEAVRGYYRYLTHMDNPEKYQYDKSDLIHLNGFDIRDYSELTSSEKDAIKKRLIELINEYGVIEYSAFINLVMSLDDSDMFHEATANTIFFNAYIKSFRYSSIGQYRPEEVEEDDDTI